MQRSAVSARLPREGGSPVKLIAALAVALLLAPSSLAGWAAGSPGSGKTGAKTMPAGNVPAGSVAGNAVTLTWTASTFAGGGSSPGYVIRRFNSVTSAESGVLSACSGTVSGTTCIESGVPIGTWKYTVTPAAGIWRGAQSAQSAVVTVLV
jgi:hypothetical protein